MKSFSEDIRYKILASMWDQMYIEMSDSLIRNVVRKFPRLQSSTLNPTFVKEQERRLDEILSSLSML